MLEVLYIGLSGALTAWMLTVWMGEGMIFGKYGDWLWKHQDKWWSKPIGSCLYCFSVWVTLGVYCLYLFYPEIWVVVSALAVGNFLVAIIDKID